jgi:hypothetical protein
LIRRPAPAAKAVLPQCLPIRGRLAGSLSLTQIAESGRTRRRQP